MNLCVVKKLVFLALASIASAENLTTVDGKSFTNIVLITNRDHYVKINHDDGTAFIVISNLPVKFREKYNLREQINPVSSITKPSAVQTINSTNLIDLFLARNKDTSLMECDSEHLDSTNHINRSCQLCLHGAEVSMTSYTTDWNVKPEQRRSEAMHFNLGQEGIVSQVFDKFIDWEEIARTNRTEPFEKEIARCRDLTWSLPSLEQWQVYSFHWDFGKASLWVSGYGGIFDKEDVAHFRLLLKRLPAFKEKLAEKIRNKEAQKNLFK